MSSEAAVLLQADGLCFGRGARAVLSGVNLCVRSGELWWLRAGNGAGKTTLLRLLLGLLPADAGTVLRSDGLRCLYIGHANALRDDLPALAALQFLHRLDNAAGTHRAVEPVLGESELQAVWQAVLQHWGLWQCRKRPVRQLSQGQQRRLALARLSLPSVSRPSMASPATQTLWVLDEPLDALDSQGVQTLWAVVQEHLAEGGAVVLTSHTPLPALDAAHAPALRELVLDAAEPISARRAA